MEYTSEDSFIESDYRFDGDAGSGWTITRNGREHLILGPGYRLLQTRYCGICSTDLARRHLPFPLPQIIGHEVVARDPDTGDEYVVEINDTCIARGDSSPEVFCRSGLPSHCPARMVLGIDRLPGGFGRWILAPVNAALPTEGLPGRAAVLIEPFAAALHAVTVSPPRSGDAAAVLGPGRLGLLIIAALSAYRAETGIDFTVTAVARNARNLDRAKALGADSVVDIGEGPAPGATYETVFDASGSIDGLETALALSRNEVHLKSTHGLEFHGIRHLTELVVDELSLLPLSEHNLEFHSESEYRRNKWLYISPGNSIIHLPGHFRSFRGSVKEGLEFLCGADFQGRLPRFDIAIASSESEIDGCIRPSIENENSIVRPRGAILFSGTAGDNPLLRHIKAGKLLRTSRCGDFRRAIRTLKQNRDILNLMESHLITHEFTADRIPAAYSQAKDSLKVVIRHD
ncbi:MAG: alcohol dehydrogenase catalytic domain-containing protein [Spirochaetes bacterium]|nr:alcohol dehydrogenase catalytic domain-containing protein [Spirochaetota bacterium]